MRRPEDSWATSAAVRATMRANRSRDTKPELRLRRAVHALGLRYRVAVRPLPGFRRTADLVFTRVKLAVFVDGCFWHGCPEHHVQAKANSEYWSDKVHRNRERDAETTEVLHREGWTVLRFWEHEDPATAAQQVSLVYWELRNWADSGVPKSSGLLSETGRIDLGTSDQHREDQA